jgi:hypothetical protein
MVTGGAQHDSFHNKGPSQGNKNCYVIGVFEAEGQNAMRMQQEHYGAWRCKQPHEEEK